MTYSITKYTYTRANKLGVVVKPSTNKTKKLDVYKKIKNKNGVIEKKVASIGAYGMNDYPTYIKTRGIKYAKTRRRLYKIRHLKDRVKMGTPGWYANKLLW